MNNFKISQATADDAKDIADIQVSAWQHNYAQILNSTYLQSLDTSLKASGWAYGISCEDAIVFIAKNSQDQTLGFCHVGRPEDDWSAGEVFSLYVSPEFQKKGVGAALLTYALNWFISKNAANCILWALADNQNALDFYVKLGFSKSGKYKMVKLGEHQYTVVKLVKVLVDK